MEEGSKKKRKIIRKWREECWARTFSLFKDFNLQRLQCNQEESTEEEEVKQQQRMMIVEDLTKKIRTEERMDAKNMWWVSELLAADSGRGWIHNRRGRYCAESGDEKERREGKDGGNCISTRWRK